MLPLLLIALLYEPFEFTTPVGFTVQHNGVCCTVGLIDHAYLDMAVLWRERGGEPWASEFTPLTTRIVYFPMAMETMFCERTVKSAVVTNGFARGLTVVINGSYPRETLPETFRSSFWQVFMVNSGRDEARAWTEEGCLA